MTNINEDVMEIDLLRLVQTLWRKAWLIVMSAVLCGALALGFAAFLLTPQYTSSVLMYVNSSSISLNGPKLSISQSDLNAAQSLIDTYTVILQTRTTLEDVMEEAELTCTYKELVEMISSEAVNGTEVFRINVTHPDPNQAAHIANAIARILPDKIASIVEGSSARIVDLAVVPEEISSPSYLKSLLIGAVLGMVFSGGAVIVRELMDDKIHDTDYLVQTYDLPMLSVIPNLKEGSRNAYDYYYREAGKGSKS